MEERGGLGTPTTYTIKCRMLPLLPLLSCSAALLCQCHHRCGLCISRGGSSCGIGMAVCRRSRSIVTARGHSCCCYHRPPPSSHPPPSFVIHHMMPNGAIVVTYLTSRSLSQRHVHSAVGLSHPPCLRIIAIASYLHASSCSQFKPASS